jgi:hypothetical protein
MQIRKGGSSGAGVSALPGPAVIEGPGARPWAATGSIPVDVLVQWALVNQRAGDAVSGLFQLEAEADGHVWQERTTLAAVEQIAQLGCRVDVSAGRADRVHPAAQAVAAAVRDLDDGGIVARCARGGAPSRWREPERWLVPWRWKVEGKQAETLYTERKLGAYCPLSTVATSESVADGRAEYLAWWDALSMLGWVLGGRALGFAVEGPSVAREPWE